MRQDVLIPIQAWNLEPGTWNLEPVYIHQWSVVQWATSRQVIHDTLTVSGRALNSPPAFRPRCPLSNVSEGQLQGTGLHHDG